MTLLFLRRPVFWVPLALVLATLAITPWIPGLLTPLQRTAVALLINGCVAVWLYLLVVILHPERF
jgi:hypothetical protein